MAKSRKTLASRASARTARERKRREEEKHRQLSGDNSVARDRVAKRHEEENRRFYKNPDPSPFEFAAREISLPKENPRPRYASYGMYRPGMMLGMVGAAGAMASMAALDALMGEGSDSDMPMILEIDVLGDLSGLRTQLVELKDKVTAARQSRQPTVHEAPKNDFRELVDELKKR